MRKILTFRLFSSCRRRIFIATNTLFFTLFLFTTSAISQININGVVTDQKNEALIGVNVQVKGTNKGTATDLEGVYKLNDIAEDAILVFSYIGYQTQEVAVDNRSTIDVTLISDSELLEEIVVVGYGRQKKVNVIGSVTAISGSEVEAIPAPDLTNAISGRLPGSVVIQGSGEPGRNSARILIRGRSTLGGAGQTSPLVVIDGIPNRSLNEIDPNDVESISVLKDAAAAIYGSSAANGVVLVTTKSGMKSGTRLNYQLYQGFLTPTILPEPAGAAQYAQYISDYQNYEGLSRLYSDRDIELFKSGVDPWEHPRTNWMNELVRDWTTASKHHLSLSGGSENISYFISAGYKNEEAFYAQESTNYKQYNLRANVDVPINDWLSASVNYAGFITDRKYPTTSTYQLVGWASLTLPTEPAFWPTGEPGPDFEGGVNPVVNSSFVAGYDELNNYKNQITLKTSIQPEFAPGLNIGAFYTLDLNNSYHKLFKKPWTLYYADWESAVRDSEGFITSMDLKPRKRGLDSPELTESYGRNTNTMSQFNVNYGKDFGDHSFSVFGAFEQFQVKSNGFNAYRKFFISDLVQTLGAGGEKDKDNDGYLNVYARSSWIGRLNYNYKGKYLAEFIFRRDGSLKFPPNSRWGNFPGLLLGWRASEEPFWKENLSAINYFKLKASYGEMGMDPGAAFQYINKYTLGTGMTIGSDREVKTKISQASLANPNITWEKQKTYNLGFESEFLDNAFFFNADVFYNRRSDILTSRNASVPDYSGLALPDENIAIVDNRGFELEGGYNSEVSKNWMITLSGNIGWSKNEVVFMDEPERAVPWQRRTGHPYGAHLVYNAIGIFRTDAELDEYPHWNGAKPGDVIFEDYNNDGVINSEDRILLDKTDFPTTFYGVKLDLNYKNWGLSILAQGQGDYFVSSISGNRGIGQNVYNWMASDYWTPETPNASNARPFHRGDQYWSYISNGSTYWYDNMAYARLKNAVLRYRFPKAWMDNIGIAGASLFLSGNNLFLIYSKQKNYDPEIADPESYPAMKTFAIGAYITF